MIQLSYLPTMNIMQKQVRINSLYTKSTLNINIFVHNIYICIHFKGMKVQDMVERPETYILARC